MALDAPAPLALGAGRAEDAEEVPARVADVAAALLQLVQDRLQAHDGRGLVEALFAGAGAEQVLGLLLLLGVHLAQHEALAGGLAVLLQGHEVPVGALLVVEGEDALGLLLLGEAVTELLGRGRHLRRGGLGFLADVGHAGQARHGQHGEQQASSGHGTIPLEVGPAWTDGVSIRKPRAKAQRRKENSTHFSPARSASDGCCVPSLALRAG